MCLSDFEHGMACSYLDYSGRMCVVHQGSHSLMNLLLAYPFKGLFFLNGRNQLCLGKKCLLFSRHVFKCQFDHEVIKGGLKGSAHTNYRYILLLTPCDIRLYREFWFLCQCFEISGILLVALKALKKNMKKKTGTAFCRLSETEISKLGQIKPQISAWLDTTGGIWENMFF